MRIWSGRWADLVAGTDRSTPFSISTVAAALCVAIGLIHIQDQGGFWGHQSPQWIRLGYYLIEVAAGISAGLLLRQKTIGWLSALGVGIVPFIGYVLSRSVGVPGDPGDVGNWGYLLGTVSLVTEGLLVVIAGFALARLRHRAAMFVSRYRSPDDLTDLERAVDERGPRRLPRSLDAEADLHRGPNGDLLRRDIDQLFGHAAGKTGS
jgi:hypothetical protein